MLVHVSLTTFPREPTLLETHLSQPDISPYLSRPGLRLPLRLRLRRRRPLEQRKQKTVNARTNKNKSQWPRHNITDYWILSQNANKMKDHVTKAFYTLTNGLPTAKPVLSQTNSWKMILLVSAFTATAISMSPINRTIYWLLLLICRIMHNRSRFSLTTLVTTPTGGCFMAPMSTAFYRCFP